MSLKWVAADVRARLLAQHRLGRGLALEVAGAGSLPAGLDRLRDTPYERALAGTGGLAEAQRAVAANLLWDLRVLAGWLPPGGIEHLRALAAWFEIANVAARLAYLAGTGPLQAFELGTLNTAWRRLARTGSPGEIRAVLAGTSWSAPASTEPRQLVTWMQAAWFRRVHGSVPEAAGWAEAALVLWTARLRSARRQVQLPPDLPGWTQAESLPDLARRLPVRLAWVLEGVEDAGQLWRAEVRWWSRVEAEALSLRGAAPPGPAAVAAAAALLAADAWRLRAVLAALARPADSREVLDAIA